MTTNGSSTGPARGDGGRRQRLQSGRRGCGRAYGGVRERHGMSRYGRIAFF